MDSKVIGRHLFGEIRREHKTCLNTGKKNNIQKKPKSTKKGSIE